jgi:hypothetical protein
MQISDVVVDRVGIKDTKSALVTLKQFCEQRPTNLHLSSRAFEHFKRKHDFSVHMNLIKLK